MDGNHARALLGVPSHAHPRHIRRAFRRAALAAHPDRGGDATTFRDLVAARDLLLAGARPETAGGTDARWADHLRTSPSPTIDLVDVTRRPAAAPTGSVPVEHVDFEDVLAVFLAA